MTQGSRWWEKQPFPWVGFRTFLGQSATTKTSPDHPCSTATPLCGCFRPSASFAVRFPRKHRYQLCIALSLSRCLLFLFLLLFSFSPSSSCFLVAVLRPQFGLLVCRSLVQLSTQLFLSFSPSTLLPFESHLPPRSAARACSIICL